MRLASIFLILFSLSAADHPNFTGTWKMNADKSSFGPLPRPMEYERKIEHNDPLIRVTVHQVAQNGEQNVDMTLRSDGKETTNTSRTGESKSTGKWVGRDLQLTTTRVIEGGEAVSQETWSLSADGRTLMSATLLKTPRATFEIKLTLEKQ